MCVQPAAPRSLGPLSRASVTENDKLMMFRPPGLGRRRASVTPPPLLLLILFGPSLPHRYFTRYSPRAPSIDFHRVSALGSSPLVPSRYFTDGSRCAVAPRKVEGDEVPWFPSPNTSSNFPFPFEQVMTHGFTCSVWGCFRWTDGRYQTRKKNLFSFYLC